MPTTFKDKAAEIAALVTEKQVLYGNSFGKSGDILRILYPHGISPDQYDEVLTVTRVLDKLFRVATSSEHETESPWDDVMGYALLAATRGGSPSPQSPPARGGEVLSPKAPDLTDEGPGAGVRQGDT